MCACACIWERVRVCVNLITVYSVMVFVVGNRHGGTSSNPHETDCISNSTNTLGKGMNPFILSPAIDE